MLLEQLQASQPPPYLEYPSSLRHAVPPLPTQAYYLLPCHHRIPPHLQALQAKIQDQVHAWDAERIALQEQQQSAEQRLTEQQLEADRLLAREKVCTDPVPFWRLT